MDIERHPKYQKEVELEQQMRGIEFHRVEQSITNAKTDERESTTPYGYNMLALLKSDWLVFLFAVASAVAVLGIVFYFASRARCCVWF
jgi:hypothetical protein